MENDEASNVSFIDTTHTKLSEEKRDKALARWTLEEKPFRLKIWKNICVLGVVFCLAFTAYDGLADIQSSLFIDEGLGVVCQSATYVAFAMSCLLLPKLVIRRIGHKWAIGGALVGYVTWMAANGYATWATMVPTSVLVGLCAGPLWTSQTALVTTLTIQYCRKTGKAIGTVTPLFFSIVLGITKTGQLLGSLISWSVLQHTWKNSSYFIREEDLEQCGANDCAWRNSTNVYFEKPPPYLLWILVGIYISIGIASILLAFFGLDDIPTSWYRPVDRLPLKKEILHSVTAAIRLHSNYKQWLLIPLSMHSGIIMSFIQSDFNKSYVTCSLGIWMVGLVFMPNIVINIMSVLISGRLGKRVGWLPQFITAYLVGASALIGCLFWRPSPDQLVVYFVISVLLGICDGIWLTQAVALISMTFPTEEAAFANHALWESVSFAISFGITPVVCVQYKIYMNLGITSIGIVCCIVIYIKKLNDKKDSDKPQELQEISHDAEKSKIIDENGLLQNSNSL